MGKTKDQPKSAQPSPAVQAKLRALHAAMQQSVQNFQRYGEGIMDGLGLEGQWTLDVDKMIFIRVESKDADNK